MVNCTLLLVSWRGFRLPQRLHLRTLKNLKNRGKIAKIGETFNKIGKPGNFEEVHFFPVSAPVLELKLFILHIFLAT